MKIALVCDWYAPRIGGIESQLSDLALALRARGHDVHVITATPGDASGAVPVHRLRAPLLPGWQVIRGREPLDALDALVDSERFDVVHAHSLYSPLALGATWVAHQRGIASVLTSHSLLDPASSFLLRSFASLTALGWGRWPDVLSAVSAACAEDLRRVSGEPDVHVLPNGIELAAWTNASPPPESAASGDVLGSDGDLHVVSVMRLHRRKRPLALLRVMREVMRRARRARLTLVGDGPQRFEAEREAWALGIRDRVTFAGAQPRAGVRELLAGADLFVLPTVREAFGIALLEARAAGLPVVAMRGGGAVDLVEHGKNGLLAEDDAQLAAHVTTLCLDPAARAGLAAHARVDLARYDWSRVAALNEALYVEARARAKARLVPSDARAAEAA